MAYATLHDRLRGPIAKGVSKRLGIKNVHALPQIEENRVKWVPVPQAEKQDIRPLHGDLHHDNIKASDRGYLAFDAKGVLGERTFELANAFQNPLGSEAIARQPETIQRRAELWSAGLNVSKPRLLSWAAAFSGLSLAWHCKSTFGPNIADQMRFVSTLIKMASSQSADHHRY